MIRVGQEVKDVVTGFTGTVVARQEHLDEAPRIGVDDLKGGGRHGDDGTVWFEECRLQVLGAKPLPTPEIRSQA